MFNRLKVHVQGEILVPRQTHIMCNVKEIDETFTCEDVAEEQERGVHFEKFNLTIMV